MRIITVPASLVLTVEHGRVTDATVHVDEAQPQLDTDDRIAWCVAARPDQRWPQASYHVGRKEGWS